MSLRKYILVVEDDTDIQEIYKEMIGASFDADLHPSLNGQEGISAVQDHKPDVIFLDLLMPVMNGQEFLTTLRGMSGMNDIPVVICSVNQSLAQKLVSEKMAQAMLPKLFTQKELETMVSRFTGLVPKS